VVEKSFLFFIRVIRHVDGVLCFELNLSGKI
jgi:hypothetical protein